MRKIICLLTVLLAAFQASAQRNFIHYNCMAQTEEHASNGSMQAPRRPLTLLTNWDASRTYPVAVVLVSFADRDFAAGDATVAVTMGDITDINERYNRMFNEDGFNRRNGPGCVREYFQTQSGGLFNPRFDVYGPVKVSAASTEGGKYGSSILRTALATLTDSLDNDFSVYDWNGDGKAESVIYIYAGYGGNDSSIENNKYIWPNTGSLSSSLTVGNTRFSGYSASAELWGNDRSCGIGTICHEYSHALGLPDIYPTSSSSTEYSICDEWDLMDGGNFTRSGWCPPNYTALEKMLLGWKSPEELTGPVSITQMKSVSEGGKAYIVYTDNPNEYFLLENRQWKGWDLYTPGHGLLITHVDYNAGTWSSNTVNNTANHHRYDIVHADNMNYDQWDEIIGEESQYVGGHNLHLSTSSYPYISDTMENRALTDSTTPAAVTYSGSKLLSKPITDIMEDEEGNISFHFMGGTPSGISDLNNEATTSNRCYNLQGRRVNSAYRGIVISNGKLKLQ